MKSIGKLGKSIGKSIGKLGDKAIITASNTANELTRIKHRYGNVHFISFLGAVLSRLAYFDDNEFLDKYNQIMGPVIQPKILEGINNVDTNNLGDLLNDQAIFGLNKSATDIFSDYEYKFREKNYIDFVKLNMPQNVNIINGDLSGNLAFPVPGQKPTPDTVKYISIGWSNYGEIFIVADKRMSNTIFVIFRGAYSARTLAAVTNPTVLIPITVCKDSNEKRETFLYGIFKASSEMIHTIVESIRYLATDFLGATTPNSVKIFTTGHSTGAAMCTDFAYLWMGIKKTSPYDAAPYNVLADNIVCVSLGSPRCMGSNVAEKFCNFAMEQKILYLRVTTRGDPIVNLPYGTGFIHPCSYDYQKRKIVSEDCNSTLNMLGTDVNYNGNLDCTEYETRVYIRNPLSHYIYLDIMYGGSAFKLTKSTVEGTMSTLKDTLTKGTAFGQEVARGNDNATICRLIMGQSGNYKAVFFDVNKARGNVSNTDADLEKELENVDPNMMKDITAPAPNQGDADINPPVDGASQVDPTVDNTAVDANATDNTATDANATDNTVVDANAVDTTITDPTVDPNAVDTNAVDPNAVDPNAVDPNAVDPNAVDPNAAEPISSDPNATDSNAVDPNASTEPISSDTNNDNTVSTADKDKPITGGGWLSWVCPKSSTKTDNIDPTADPSNNNLTGDASNNNVTENNNETGDSSTGNTTGSKPSILSRISKLMKIGGAVSEDIKMTSQSFNALIQQMVPVQGNLCPLKGNIVDPFDSQVMPNLACPGIKFGGGKLSRRSTRKIKASRKFKTSRKFGKLRTSRKFRSSRKHRSIKHKRPKVLQTRRK